MKKILIIITVLAIVGIGIYYIVSNNNYMTSNIPESATQSPVTPTSTASVPNTTTISVPENVTVNIKNFSFNPSTLTVKTGTKVTWVNNDNVSHTVTSDSGNLLNSGTLSPGQSFSFTFTNSGPINYHCVIHPMMKGSITVKN